MKKNAIKILSLMLCLAAMAGLLCSCTPKMTVTLGGYTCSENGKLYATVASNYMPKAKSTEVFAVFTYNDVEMNFYTIEGDESEDWLADADGQLYYAGEDTLPSLSGFGAEQMLICYNTDTPFSLISESDSEFIEKVINRYENGEEASFNEYNYTTYQIIFISDKYEYLYYRLRLAVCETEMYLFDRSTLRYVNVTDLFSQYDDIAYDPENFE